MKLIKDWRNAWRYYTIHIDAIAAIVGVVAGLLTEDYRALLLTVFGVINAIARIIDQPENPKKEAEDYSQWGV